jgi:flagella basal body P-ring formation protein FlgA
MFLHAKVTTSLPVLVATKIISKGSTISNGNIAIEYRDKNKIRGEVLTTSEGLIGAKAKRRIAKNSLITHKYLCMVCKGDSVSIEVKSKTFMIKSSGIALTDGSIGEQIKIKNSQSGKIITARIKAINKVEINL